MDDQGILEDRCFFLRYSLTPKERGVAFGRKKKLTTQQIGEMRQRRKQGTLIKTLMKDYDLSKASVYRLLEEDELSVSAGSE